MEVKDESILIQKELQRNTEILIKKICLQIDMIEKELDKIG